MASADLIPASAWQVITQAGNDEKSITFPATCDVSKSYILFFESDATSEHATNCMKEGIAFRIIYQGIAPAMAQNCMDKNGTIRIPTISASATEVRMATTSVQFASDVNYTLHYAEFVAE